MSTAIAPPTTALHVERRQLLAALDRVVRVINTRGCKPILQGVRLEASAGQLQLAATDLDLSITATVRAEGELPRCVVPCVELSRRLKASKTHGCTLAFDAERDALIINGGCVEHVLHTLEAAEFPPVPDRPAGQILQVSAKELKTALDVALVAVARESSRYAINGVLLESNAQGTRLVATDGRRLVTVELEHGTSVYTGQVILPARLVTLLTRFADCRQEEFVTLHVASPAEQDGAAQPARLYAGGRDWLLATTAVDGAFPRYRDVMPPSGRRFIVDRVQFLALVHEVAQATDIVYKGTCIELAADRVQVRAGSAGSGTACGTLPATSPNDSSRRIRTGFNARFLLDAVRSLSGERLVIDVQPNQRSKTSGAIIQKPGRFYTEDAPQVRWLIMPVSV